VTDYQKQQRHAILSHLLPSKASQLSYQRTQQHKLAMPEIQHSQRHFNAGAGAANWTTACIWQGPIHSAYLCYQEEREDLMLCDCQRREGSTANCEFTQIQIAMKANCFSATWLLNWHLSWDT